MARRYSARKKELVSRSPDWGLHDPDEAVEQNQGRTINMPTAQQNGRDSFESRPFLTGRKRRDSNPRSQP